MTPHGKADFLALSWIAWGPLWTAEMHNGPALLSLAYKIESIPDSEDHHLPGSGGKNANRAGPAPLPHIGQAPLDVLAVGRCQGNG